MTIETRACANCQTALPADALFCLKCGTPTPTEPGVPERTMPTGAVEVHRVRQALADRYTIERVLGEGGMATVYLAEDLKHHRKVAVKVMRPELAETLGTDRFLREVEIAAKLNHQNILPVYDSGAADGILYFVMPVVEGESLPARLKREKHLPVGEALRLTREVAEALAYAHKRGIIHRDIKPANILIHEGHALVSDFGIARATEDAGALTKTGIAIGTPSYMSPEQASGETNLDGRTDVYALGCVLYEMLAGEPPFTGPTAQAIITRSITEEPRPLTRSRSGLAPAVDAAVLQALAKSPADRYATATDMATALTHAEDLMRTGSGTTPIAAAPAQKLKPWMLAVAAVAVLAIGAGGMKLFGGGGTGNSGSAVKSMAVLPFENLGAADDSYFADGIVDELRNRLARLDKFTVIASSSADEYRNSPKGPTEIARELHVEQVLMGKVRWATNAKGVKQFKVTTELVDGATGKVTWSDSFDGDLSDPFAVQGQIATRAAGALGTVLGQDEAQDLAGRATDNAEAYDLFLKGKVITGTGAVAAREQAGYMERAVALDSNFAAAWGYLAGALTSSWVGGTRDPAVARRAKEALDKAMALAPDSAAVHLVATIYYRTIARDQAAARRETEEALRLDPKNGWALRSMAAYDLADGNFQAMSDKLARAREVDPLNKANLSSLIRAQIYTGRYKEALATADELQALGPTDFGQMQWIAGAHLVNDDLEGAKRAVAESAQGVSETDLVAYFAGYFEMSFVLTDEQRQLLYRMNPASFDNDRAWWGQALSIAAWQEGDLVRARAYADSSLKVAKVQIDNAPADAQLRLLNALALAIAGRKAEALREGERAMIDTVGLSDDNISYVLQTYARTLTAADEKERAIDVLEKLVGRQYYVTPNWLRADPSYTSLAGIPRFERLANRGVGAPVD
ncbi:MAG TPA: protein kinase [Gemmatimonadales bacterium]|nr:protein kinase [Gemmatimonadales bacterium]